MDEAPVRYMLGCLWDDGRLGVITMTGAFHRREDAEQLAKDWTEQSPQTYGHYIVLKVEPA